MRRRRAAVAAGAVAAIGATGWALAPGRPAASPAATGVKTGTATVAARELVDREDVNGTLGFAGERMVASAATGTLTRLRPEGSTVRRGESLYSVDATATARVLYGEVPMYRTLRSGVEDGSDVRQLERNLVALGHDPGDEIEVDAEWDWATTAAVRRFQDARGDTEDGAVEPAEVVVSDGAARVGKHRAEVGDAVRAGAPVAALTSRRRIVTARLGASRQGAVRRGAAVVVTLPDGAEVRGTVTRVGRVATAGEQGEEATVELRVGLRRRAARQARYDGAPVTVAIATQRTRAATAVPVSALLARGAGRYALEIRGRGLVDVEVGAFADGYVEVTGPGVVAGAKVVVPA